MKQNPLLIQNAEIHCDFTDFTISVTHWWKCFSGAPWCSLFTVHTVIYKEQNLFLVLDQKSNGLMVSLCVSRPIINQVSVFAKQEIYIL